MRNEAGSDDRWLQERGYGLANRQLRRHTGKQTVRHAGLRASLGGRKGHKPFCPASSMVLLLLQLP